MSHGFCVFCPAKSKWLHSLQLCGLSFTGCLSGCLLKTFHSLFYTFILFSCSDPFLRVFFGCYSMAELSMIRAPPISRDTGYVVHCLTDPDLKISRFLLSMHHIGTCYKAETKQDLPELFSIERDLGVLHRNNDPHSLKVLVSSALVALVILGVLRGYQNWKRLIWSCLICKT